VHPFTPSYVDDRADFEVAARALGGQLERHPIVAPGPHGEALTVDVARFGAARAARLLVLVSSTHGVEGPAGSALQRDFMRRLQPHLRLPDDAAVLYVHALNPWGHAWHRRQNEDNVDLNRNFLDFDARLPERPDYAALDALLNPAASPLAPDAARSFLRALGALSRERGRAWVQRTLIEGQYDFPRGLYFGGRAPVASNRILHDVLARHAAGVTDGLVVDLHTGMGAFGDCLLLPAHAPGSAAFAWLERGFARQRMVLPTLDEHSPAVPLSGKWSHAMHALHPALRFLTVEFGTILDEEGPDEEMIVAEWRENWLHHHGDRGSPEAEAIVQAIRATSCPQDDGWRARVLAQGSAVLLDAWRLLFGDGAR
jgi:polar amino acid transport system ATP-binding protein